MVIDKVLNLINIIESQNLNNSHYKHYILEELTNTMNQPTTPPKKGKGLGLLMKGGLAIGGGLLANHLIQSNPGLKHEFDSLTKHISGAATKGLAAVNDKISSEDTGKSYSGIKGDLNSAKDVESAHDNLKRAQDNFSNLTKSEQDQAIADKIKFKEHAGEYNTRYGKSYSDLNSDDVKKVGTPEQQEKMSKLDGTDISSRVSKVINKPLNNIANNYNNIKTSVVDSVLGKSK